MLRKYIFYAFLFLSQFNISFTKDYFLPESKIMQEREIIINQNSNVRYSDLVRVKFKKNIFHKTVNDYLHKLKSFISPNAKDYLNELKKHYGNFKIKSVSIPDEMRGQFIMNKRTKQMVSIPDWSRLYEFYFDDLVPIDSIINDLNKCDLVDYAEGPVQAATLISPNDERYSDSSNWAFDAIEAEQGWNITKGNPKIVIALHDKFGAKSHNQIHEDLLEKVDRNFGKFGNHGCCVAGIAGASTDNDIGIAGLGWNLRLKFYDMTYSFQGILEAVADGVDVINFSHCSRVDQPTIRDAIKTALAAGIILVASAGNNCYDIPDFLYPAAYNFGELGQVIGVSSTGMKSGRELFVEGWNYSPPGNNQFTDPSSVFVDVAAPGKNILMLDPENPNGYKIGSGTSLSSAFVSALAGLILSVNKKFTPAEVYEIIKSTADKIGQYEYDINGWNQYLGYGRINVYKALKKAKKLTLARKDKIASVDLGHLKDPGILFQNFPNPFNPSTKIKYEIIKESYVCLEVFNAVGQRIATLFDGDKNAGIHEERFCAGNNYASGIYIFKLTVDGHSQIIRGILLK